MAHMPPFCPPISMSGMLNDKDVISSRAFWESPSTQHSRKSVDQSWHESQNSFAIPTTTRCKPSFPKITTISACLCRSSSHHRYGLPVFVNNICCFVSSPLTWVQAAMDISSKLTESCFTRWSLFSENFVRPYGCFLGLTQGQPRNVGELKLWESNPQWGAILIPPLGRGESENKHPALPPHSRKVPMGVPYGFSEDPERDWVWVHAVIICSLVCFTSLIHFLPSLFVLPRSLKSPSQGKFWENPN